ncbi:MAG: preprotein translocase subunit SecG [Methylotenera sp.]|nr:preprotein translocase subunit SecG [Oligoflexia bacterium]
MHTLITVLHVSVCLILVLIVLVQSGKGAEISASFGGSSQTVFGSSGGANFFTRFTIGLAAVFMVTSMVLTIMANRSRKSLFEGAAPAPITVPGNKPVMPIDPTAPRNTSVPAAPAAPAAAAPAAPAAPAGTTPAH